MLYTDPYMMYIAKGAAKPESVQSSVGPGLFLLMLLRLSQPA